MVFITIFLVLSVIELFIIHVKYAEIKTTAEHVNSIAGIAAIVAGKRAAYERGASVVYRIVSFLKRYAWIGFVILLAVNLVASALLSIAYGIISSLI